MGKVAGLESGKGAGYANGCINIANVVPWFPASSCIRMSEHRHTERH